MMKHRSLPSAVLLMLASGALAASAAPANPSHPNILFILADDLGWMDVGFQGNPHVETPNLDRLAAQGMVFSQAYSYPLCTPTRAALMTGKHPARLRMTRVFDEFDRGEVDQPSIYHPVNRQKPGGWDELSPETCPDLPLEEITLGELAKAAGYRTAFMGKWHLGFKEFYPEHQGFDVVFRGDHWSDYFAPYAGERVQGDSVPGEHVADRLATEAIRFIRESRDTPFLLCAWFYDVHTPIEAKRELVEHYAKKLGQDASMHPVYAAMVHSLDENVGRILQALEDEGLADDTLVLFMSDNGGLARVGASAVFDPRDSTTGHPAKDSIDLARCRESIGQSFRAPGGAFELGLTVTAGPETVGLAERSGHHRAASTAEARPGGANPAVIRVVILEEAEGRRREVAVDEFSIEQLGQQPSLRLQVERPGIAAGSPLRMVVTKPAGLAPGVLRLPANVHDTYLGGTLLIDGRPAAGDLALQIRPMGAPRPNMLTLTTNAPLRGQKIELHEGGIRVPFTVRWPGVTAAGGRCDVPVVAMDVLPTLAGLLGQKPPPVLDGVDLRPLLEGRSKLDRDALYWHYPHYMFQQGGVAIRQGDFKLIEFFVDGRVELYNLATDIGEQKNLARAQPERVAEMRDQLQRWQREIGASQPSRAQP